MQSRDGQRSCNPPLARANRAAATNDGTLNAIVSKSVRPLDVPLAHASSHEDEMLSWLHYPVEDPLERGYCSDIFVDLPNSSAMAVRQTFLEPGLRPLCAPSNTGSFAFSGSLSHARTAASCINTFTVASGSRRDAVGTCGSGQEDTSFRVAGADAVLGLGACRAAGVTSSHKGLEVYNKSDTEKEGLRGEGSGVQPICESSPLSEAPRTQSESSQGLLQVSSQIQGSLTGITPVTSVQSHLEAVNCHFPSLAAGKHVDGNFALFSRPAVELKANLHVLGESSGPTNIERVRQQTGTQGPLPEIASTGAIQTNLASSQSNWLSSPVPPHPLLLLPRPLPPPLPPISNISAPPGKLPLFSLFPLPPPPSTSAIEARDQSKRSKVVEELPSHVSSAMALGKCAVVSTSRSQSVHTLQSSASDLRDDTNLSRDTGICSRMSTVLAEKGLRSGDQAATSPSRCSGSSTEKSGKVTDVSMKRKLGTTEDSDYQSEYMEEVVAMNKKSSSHAKRLRTAEMHNQSERKRRVKINDKLRTLQQLIPNGNKPDKASLLDAAIEYIKLLQSQLQMISMRTGIDLSMGVGLGMGMRMGVGTMDANVAAVMPMPLFPNPFSSPHSSHSASLQPTDCLQSPGMMNPHNYYVRPSHYVQAMMSQTAPMCSTPQASMQIQQPPLQLQFQQSPRVPGTAGKRPFY